MHMGNTHLFCAVWALVAGVASAKIGGWDTSPNTQYHIQTDEGPERYFKYQTLSGQYRKEKRLEDGTVVGTYGWVDADGYLRLRDYIADAKGYRIVRTKKVLVGVDTPISNAVSAAKKVPSQGGVGVENAKIYERPKPPPSPTPSPFAYSSSPSSTYRPELASNSLDYSPSTPRPIALADYLKQAKEAERYPSSTFAPINVPEVYITPNSYPSNYPSSTSSPTAYYPPSNPEPYYPSSTPSPSGYYPSSTPAPSAYYPSSTPAPSTYYPSSTPAPSAYYPSSTPEPVRPQTFRPYLDPNSLSGYDPSGARRAYESVGASKYSSPGDQQPLYDGVSLTHNGFRYYLPRHYHEEETLPGDQRAGSFGYVDPFGIRRVIYYNASPGSGFVHRKNNRYVGFHSTPYDPRF